MVEYTRDGLSWSESFDLLDLAIAALKNRGHAVLREKAWLEHPPTGYRLIPQVVEFQAFDEGSVRTTTTIQINHPTVAPKGIFEYQHAAGKNVAESFSAGFDQWVQTDFVTLVDALRPKPESCTTLEMVFPERTRRAVLGPVALLQNSEKAPA